MEEKPNYYAIIPADVRYDKNLKDKAKLLYGEITALSNKDGYCYANNKYFADLYQVNIRTIKDLIKSLIDRGYIKSVIVYKDNSKEVMQRKLYLVKKFSPPGEEIFTRGGEEIFTENNTSINNKKENIIINNNIKEKYFENEKLNDLFIEFLKQRKKLKAINSDRAINQLLAKLEPYDDLVKEQMIEESLVNSWKSVFPIKKQKEQKKEEWWNKYEN